MPLPIAFERRMQGLLGEEYPAFREALARPQARGLRVNPLKISPEQFAKQAPFTLKPVPWAAEGFFYPETERPGRHPYYEAGVYYIQEPSAMAVGTLADAKPGENILDLCAAPGGKTTHLAGRMQGKGLLVANEINTARSAVLAQTVERMGITNCIVLNETPERLVPHFTNFFDKIIVDAPCSGEGMFRKDDNPAQTEWTEDLPIFCAQRQAGILDCAAKMLRGGGKLIYSTCTFAPEENEGTISRFLEWHPEFEMVQLKYPSEQFAPARPDWIENGNPAVTAAFRLWPHRLNGEGHFAAVLCKTEGEIQQLPRLCIDKKVALEQITKLPENSFVIQRRDKLVVLPEACCTDLTGLRVKSSGVELGILKKNRFEPSHAAAHALPLSYFERVCHVEVDYAERYLRGETFPYDGEKGWTVIAIDGFALGWGKCANGMMKNHYPKGLRWIGKTC